MSRSCEGFLLFFSRFALTLWSLPSNDSLCNEAFQVHLAAVAVLMAFFPVDLRYGSELGNLRLGKLFKEVSAKPGWGPMQREDSVENLVLITLLLQGKQLKL